MKERTGWVSNSSSSSFIIINSSSGNMASELTPFIKGGVLKVNWEIGESEFGWGPDDLSGTGDKVNFSWLIANYMGREEWKEMLTEVLIEELGCEEVEYDLEDGYIDHQSVEETNSVMFVNKDSLKSFLFSSESYIHVDNDNH
jgi:hypothetical protein